MQTISKIKNISSFGIIRTFIVLFAIILTPELSSAEEFTCDGIKYTPIADKAEVMVSGYEKGLSGDLIIPETVSYNNTEYTVTQIGKSAMSHCSGLTSISFPNSLKVISNYAIEFCESLKQLVLPNSLVEIGDFAFYVCKDLTSIIIPGSVVTIGINPFLCCFSLQSIDVAEDNPEYMSIDGVLYNSAVTTLISAPCAKKTVDIPESVTTIGTKAFYNSNIDTLVLPESVTTIEESAFAASYLDSIKFSNNLTTMGSAAFMNCYSLDNVFLPNSLTTVPDYAFASCYSM